MPLQPGVSASSSSGTTSISASDGTFAVFYSPSNPKVNLGTDSITGIDRVRNIVDGTLTTVSNLTTGNLNTVTRVDRVMNVIDGTITIAGTNSSLAVFLDPGHLLGNVNVNPGVGTLVVGGDTAGAATDSGNPVKIGGRANTSPPTFAAGQRADLWSTLQGGVMASMFGNTATNGSDGTSLLNIIAAGSASPSTPPATAATYVWNGASWDRARGGSGVASAAQRVVLATDVASSMVVNSGTIDTVSMVQRVNNVVDGTLTTITGVDRVRNIVDGTLTTVSNLTTGNLNTVTRVDRVFNVIDGTLTTLTGITNALPSGTNDLGNLIRVKNLIDGTLSTVTGVDRVRNIVDGTISLVSTVTGIDRVRNVIDGTLTTVTGLDRVRNVVDGTLTTVTTVGNITNIPGVDRVRNVVDGTLSLVSLVPMVQRVNNVIDGTLSLVAMTQRVNNVIDGTIGISRFGTNAVVTPNAGIPVINASNTMSIFTVSGSSVAVSTSGLTLVAPSASYNFKVFAYSITTTGIVGKTVRFTNGSGASPTEFWRLGLQAPTTSSTGANFAVQPPGFLFATGTSTTLSLLLDTASLVHYSVSYIKESA